MVACNEISQTLNLFEQFNDIDSLINTFCHIVTKRLECDEIEYDIQFLSCSCQITKSEREKVVRKHKSTTQKRSLDDKRKDEYTNLEPVQKKIMLEKAALNHNKMDPMKKKLLNETKTQKYKSMDPIKKKVLLDSQTKIYKSMDPFKKKVLNETNTQKYKLMDPMKKKVLLDSQTKKHKLSMDLVHNLDDYIKRFRCKIKGPYYICSVCNRLLYKKSVISLNQNKYTNVPESLFTDLKLFNKK